MTKLVVGIFGHHSDAALAIEDLLSGGIKKKQISAVTKQKNTMARISEDTGIGPTKLGAGNGGMFGTAREIGVGLDMIPDTAVAAGPAATKLAGADLDIDGLAVSLIGSGIPQEDALKYAEHADLEHIIVFVELYAESGAEEQEKAHAIMAGHNALPL
ncbi:general stress protein [Paenibacillus tengchongensis]|uniref:general stress protein n=1 Tax=Paenibacillus tengchongensis TaxID=2608684 RepID=UPI00124DAB4D|nr:general stress protein [Paenibacillus tengchongensis]